MMIDAAGDGGSKRDDDHNDCDGENDSDAEDHEW